MAGWTVICRAADEGWMSRTESGRVKARQQAWFALLGLIAGGLSAGAVFLPLGRAPGVEVLGGCVGTRALNECSGFGLASYIFPGLIFGVVCGAELCRAGVLRASSASLFAVMATVCNAVAVASALFVFDRLP